MTETMQALMLTAIHKLEVLDVPKPTVEADDDVLVLSLIHISEPTRH